MREIIESGSNTVFTVEMMRRIGIDHLDLLVPDNQWRFKSIVDYLEKHPEPSLFISKAKMLNSAKTNDEKLRYLDEYVQLHTKKGEVQKQLSKLDEEISMYER